MYIPNIERDVILAPYTTYNIGGPADLFVLVRSKKQLTDTVIWARESNIPYFVLGTGANILFGDKGYRGLVIRNESSHVFISGNLLTTESGATIEDLIKITRDHNLSGFEHFAGIPSTVGGALWQNLHFLSPDRTQTIFIESILNSAEMLDENNNIMIEEKDFFEFGYDQSILHHRNLIVTEATFLLEPCEKVVIQKQIEENLKWRAEKHPPLVEFPSCGSVFKKIEGVGAGRLIEKVGLKGYRVGGAMVSEKHANFIVNMGNATALDVMFLIRFIQDKVRIEEGFELKTEIGLVGEF